MGSTVTGFSNSVAIAGVGETDYSRASGRTELMLALEAITAALADAGVEPGEVDGLMKWWVDTSTEAEVAANLGIADLAWWGRNQPGGERRRRPWSPNAAAAIHAGLANVVVIYRGVNGRSGRRYGRGDVTGQRGRAGGGRVQRTLRAADAAARLGHGRPTPHVRNRRDEPALRHAGPWPNAPTPTAIRERHSTTRPPDAGRNTRHRASSSIRSTSSTAAWRPTAVAPWFSCRRRGRASVVARCR